MTRLAPFILCICVLCLAAALRFHLLGAQSFWNDEGSSFVQATRAFADIAYHAGRDIHPPGYYWLLATWRSLTGQTEFTLRLLSALASVLTAAFTYGLGRRLYGAGAGLIAALFVSLNTFSLYYAQEARMYALLALWGAASMWALAGFQQSVLLGQTWRQRWRDLMLLALFNGAGLYTHYAYVYVMLAQGLLTCLWLLSMARGSGERLGFHHPAMVGLSRYVVANLLTLALFLPWLPTAVQQVSAWPNTGQGISLAEALSIILNGLMIGITSQNASLAVAWLLLLFGLINRPRGAWWALLVPVVWVVVSVGLFLGQGLFRESNLKFLLPAQIGMALWLARGVWVLGDQLAALSSQRANRAGALQTAHAVGRLAGAASAIWILSMSWAGVERLYHDPDFQRDDYRALARLIGEESLAGDLVILNGPNQAEVFNYYYHGNAMVIGLPPGLGGDDAATSREMQRLMTEASLQTDRPYTRWFGVFWGDRERDPSQIVEGFLDRHAFSLGDTWFGDVRLAQYLQPVTTWRPARADVNAHFHDLANDTRIMLLDGEYDDSAIAGGAILVQLTWLHEGSEPIAQPYKVFVQLLDSRGALVAQQDGEPGGNAHPTTMWQPGEVFDDRHAVRVPQDAVAGNYTLIVGLYALNPPNERLTLADGERDYVEMGTISVR